MKQTAFAKEKESVWDTVVTHNYYGQTPVEYACSAMQEKHFIVKDQKKLNNICVNKTVVNLSNGCVSPKVESLSLFPRKLQQIRKHDYAIW